MIKKKTSSKHIFVNFAIVLAVFMAALSFTFYADAVTDYPIRKFIADIDDSNTLQLKIIGMINKDDIKYNGEIKFSIIDSDRIKKSDSCIDSKISIDSFGSFNGIVNLLGYWEPGTYKIDGKYNGKRIGSDEFTIPFSTLREPDKEKNLDSVDSCTELSSPTENIAESVFESFTIKNPTLYHNDQPVYVEISGKLKDGSLNKGLWVFFNITTPEDDKIKNRIPLTAEPFEYSFMIDTNNVVLGTHEIQAVYGPKKSDVLTFEIIDSPDTAPTDSPNLIHQQTTIVTGSNQSETYEIIPKKDTAESSQLEEFDTSQSTMNQDKIQKLVFGIYIESHSATNKELLKKIALESKSYWEKIVPNIIFTIVEDTQKSDFIVRDVVIDEKERLGIVKTEAKFGKPTIDINVTQINKVLKENETFEILTKIIKHEIGHVLGLSHSNNQNDIMFENTYIDTEELFITTPPPNSITFNPIITVPELAHEIALSLSEENMSIINKKNDLEQLPNELFEPVLIKMVDLYLQEKQTLYDTYRHLVTQQRYEGTSNTSTIFLLSSVADHIDNKLQTKVDSLQYEINKIISEEIFKNHSQEFIDLQTHLTKYEQRQQIKEKFQSERYILNNTDTAALKLTVNNSENNFSEYLEVLDNTIKQYEGLEVFDIQEQDYRFLNDVALIKGQLKDDMINMPAYISQEKHDNEFQMLQEMNNYLEEQDNRLSLLKKYETHLNKTSLEYTPQFVQPIEKLVIKLEDMPKEKIDEKSYSPDFSLIGKNIDNKIWPFMTNDENFEKFKKEMIELDINREPEEIKNEIIELNKSMNDIIKTKAIKYKENLELENIIELEKERTQLKKELFDQLEPIVPRMEGSMNCDYFYEKENVMLRGHISTNYRQSSEPLYFKLSTSTDPKNDSFCQVKYWKDTMVDEDLKNKIYTLMKNEYSLKKLEQENKQQLEEKIKRESDKTTELKQEVFDQLESIATWGKLNCDYFDEKENLTLDIDIFFNHPDTDESMVIRLNTSIGSKDYPQCNMVTANEDVVFITVIKDVELKNKIYTLMKNEYSLKKLEQENKQQLEEKIKRESDKTTELKQEVFDQLELLSQWKGFICSYFYEQENVMLRGHISNNLLQDTHNPLNLKFDVSINSPDNSFCHTVRNHEVIIIEDVELKNKIYTLMENEYSLKKLEQENKQQLEELGELNKELSDLRRHIELTNRSNYYNWSYEIQVDINEVKLGEEEYEIYDKLVEMTKNTTLKEVVEENKNLENDLIQLKVIRETITKIEPWFLQYYYNDLMIHKNIEEKKQEIYDNQELTRKIIDGLVLEEKINNTLNSILKLEELNDTYTLKGFLIQNPYFKEYADELIPKYKIQREFLADNLNLQKPSSEYEYPFFN